MAGIYLYLFVPETLTAEKRAKKSKQDKLSKNPLKSLRQINKHPIVLWVSIVLMMVSLPESGIIDVAANVFSETLNVDSNKCNLMVTLMCGGVGVGMSFMHCPSFLFYS